MFVRMLILIEGGNHPSMRLSSTEHRDIDPSTSWITALLNEQEFQAGLARLCLAPGTWLVIGAAAASERRMACIALHRATPRMICLAENDMSLPTFPAEEDMPIGYESATTGKRPTWMRYVET
ncbi:hypothetical protein J7T55_011565 [Diaporthe amygdali]|uniref:uncharacterized protein n=1 Tax=Phomopsis amygdali TaxID=1214568 RepID=UPI0022FED7C9|nr:uncharacterized protein J7T55_011565 [Diaporthe amygdali]KAJ0123101.1 hypothetical protein J7T55_011565 [Diaporthe amygdali]